MPARLYWLSTLLLCCLISLSSNYLLSPASSIDVSTFFAQQNELLRQRRHLEYLATYNYNTNVSEENRLAMINTVTQNALASKQLAQLIKAYKYDKLPDPLIQRQAAKLSDIGHDVLDEKDFTLLQNAISAMQSNYATVKVCAYGNASDCSLSLEPHVQERMAKSRDPKELAHYWQQWYDKAGTPMKANFATYVALSQKAAHLNNFRSYADYWLHFYEDPEFETNLDAAFNAVLPFYREIHGYVRYQLRQHYGDDIVPVLGNIPMHLLGNLWAQSWEEPIELFTPFKNTPFVDVTAEMKRQKFTPLTLFQLGDAFFKSLNLRALPDSFWQLSVLEKPADRNIICHASAWDLYQDSDVRIKMCTELDTHYLYVVHHELGHIQYYLQYEQQPTVYRDAPNPGFHEAVGDVIALSVSTPKHLHKIGLSPIAQLSQQSRINELFKTALKKVVFLPFAYTMDKYRYAVFRGELDDSNWNCGFWQMRSQFSGVEPPVARTEYDFDPPAKYHIDADVEYLRYFAAHIFQFQIHKALCIKAGQFVPGDPYLTLDNCDIYNSKEAGAALQKFLSLGASVHWKVALEQLTGETTMDPAALLEFMAPLRIWLQAEIKRLNIPLGWEPTNKVAANCCPAFST